MPPPYTKHYLRKQSVFFKAENCWEENREFLKIQTLNRNEEFVEISFSQKTLLRNEVAVDIWFSLKNKWNKILKPRKDCWIFFGNYRSEKNCRVLIGQKFLRKWLLNSPLHQLTVKVYPLARGFFCGGFIKSTTLRRY